MLKFQLSGVINYDVGSCHDAREVRFCKAITAPDMESAVKKGNHRYCIDSTDLIRIIV